MREKEKARKSTDMFVIGDENRLPFRFNDSVTLKDLANCCKKDGRK
jgi:hypothetical protein